MKRAIVTTSINEPTEAIIKFADIAVRDDWHFFIVGDRKTPKYNLPTKFKKHVTFLSPKEQELKYPELSRLIGWDCIQRRNIGFLEAYKWGAEIIATVDDDNIPLDGWGQNVLVGQTVEVQTYKTKQHVFDPFSATNNYTFWHRGFPIELLKEKNMITIDAMKPRKVLVQADFWYGAPDIDAVCRIAHSDPHCIFTFKEPFCSDTIAPFNSQNTFLHRSVMRDYFMYPGIGRMDDIFAAYWLQHAFPRSVIFSPASVIQKRNPHNVAKDLEQELIGYKHSKEVAMSPLALEYILPGFAKKAFTLYQQEIDTVDNS